ncbi:MAG: GGDEF domain-containing protein [Acidobacteria bacterium]|nr:GGDEF domain-containing protein [Acidobacteriota bacterium]
MSQDSAPQFQRDEETTIHAAHVNEAKVVHVPYVVVLAGDVSGRVIRLKPGRQMDAGRSRNCDIFLDDQNISRRHSRFVVHANGDTILEDLDSTNGTLVNGKKIDSVKLCDGDRICLGNVILRYSLKDDLEFVFQQELFEKATKDPLTGAHNKAFFLDAFQKEFNYHSRYEKPLSVLIFDLDNFKKINDVYGHVNGDIVLKTFAEQIISCLRKEDLFARFGGEEFMALFRNTTKETALRIGGKLLELVRAMKFSTPSAEFQTSVTIGVATLENDNFDSPQSMIVCADSRLYQGKQNGKDQVVG